MFSAFQNIALHLIWLALPAGYGIVAEHNVPEVLPLNDPVSVQWAIHKGDLEGFAKFTLHVPDHLEVSARNVNGASFSFEEGTAKLIWMDLPDVPTLAIGLDLVARPGFEAGGLEPVFSFVRNGDRIDLQLETADVRLDPKSLPLGEAHYAVERFVDPSGQVTLKVDCQPTLGFLKIDEQLPPKCKVEVLADQGATASMVDGTMKWVWFEAPQLSTFELSYRLECVGRALDEVNWNGEVSYVSNDQPVSAAIAMTAMPKPTVAEVVEDERVVDEAPKAEVTYRVQVMAAHRFVSGKWVNQRFGFAGTIDVEEQDAWYKYTTGELTQYHTARAMRESLRRSHNFPGPFVTAYLRGQRISVQEALALSSQQWIP